MNLLTRTITTSAKNVQFRPLAARSFIQRTVIATTSYSTCSRLQIHRPSRTKQFIQRRSYSTHNHDGDKTDSDNASFSDPTRPDIFYHLVQRSNAPPSFAVSFLSTPPSSPESSTIIGWLPAVEGAGLNDFKENQHFRKILHEAIQAGLREDVDEVQRNGAIQQQSGWMHIHDDRNVPALGRIGDVDDIIGTVLVEDGKILPETYQSMPAYRLVTADGLTKLTPGLAMKLESMLQFTEDQKPRL